MNVFSNKTCAVHYTINVVSKAGADVVRTITSSKFLEEDVRFLVGA